MIDEFPWVLGTSAPEINRTLSSIQAVLEEKKRDTSRLKLERYAVTGGMPRYLAALGGPSLPDAVCDQLLQPDAPLWNEGRTIVGQELREPAVHFAILEQLADGDKQRTEITGPLRLPGATVSRYLASLESLRLVHRRLPFGAYPTARAGHWSLHDPFLHFWFRFVFPFQADLEAGLTPAAMTCVEPGGAAPRKLTSSGWRDAGSPSSGKPSGPPCRST